MSTNSPAGSAPAHRRIQLGDVVGYRYLIRSESGQVLAVSAEVVHYLHGGDGTHPRALASRMEGRENGESFTTTLAPNEAFGSRDGVRKLALPRERFPALLELKPGMRVETKAADGAAMSVWVAETSESDVLIDFDHPLAGRTLHFEVSIISIRVASKDEKEDGHPAQQLKRSVAQDVELERSVETLSKSSRDADLQAQLLDMRALLERSGEEGEGGPFEDMEASGSGNGQRADALRTTQESLLAQLDSLVARVKLDEPGYDHRPALASLVAALERHDVVESELLQDSLNIDVGGEG